MRRTIEILLTVLTLLLFATAFVSCKRNENTARINAAGQLSKGFSCAADVAFGGKKYAVKISRPEGGSFSMNFTSPPELASLGFELDDGSLVVSYDGLAAKVDPSAVPQAAIANAVSSALTRAAAGDGVTASVGSGTVCLSGSCPAGPFTMTFGKNYIPQSLKLPKLGMTLSLSGYKTI